MNKPALIFRSIHESDIEHYGNAIICELLKQAGFSLEGPITRYRQPATTMQPRAVWVFCQRVDWKNSFEFQQIREHLKKATPIHSKKAQGLIFAL